MTATKAKNSAVGLQEEDVDHCKDQETEHRQSEQLLLMAEAEMVATNKDHPKT